MLLKTLYLLIFLCINSVLYGQVKIAKTPLSRHFEPTDYKAGIQNWDFSLDSSGVLFVANNFGLLEFDGKKWSNYGVPSSTKLRTLHISDENKIFIGAQGQIGYFFRGKHGMEFVSLIERLAENKRNVAEVWDIIPIKDVLYFGTSDRILRYQNEQFEDIELPHKLQSVCSVHDQMMIAQFFNQGLFIYINDTFEYLPNTSGLTEEIIAIHMNEDHYSIINSVGKIYSYKNKRLIEVPMNIWPEGTEINVSTQLSNGDFAIGTQNDGLFIVDNKFKLKRHLSKKSGLNDRTVHAIQEDRFGNLWIGLNSGIDYLELSSPISIVSEDVGLEGTGYTATVWNGKTYLGTSNGVFTFSDSKGIASYELVENTEGQVYNLSVANDILTINQHKGAFQITTSGDVFSIKDWGTWIVKEISNNQALLGTYSGISLIKYKQGRWFESRNFENFNETSRLLEFENDSTIWMTHGYKGAYLLEFDREFQTLKRFERFGSDKGFPSNVLISVYKLQDHLVFTGERGIYQFDPEGRKFVSNQFLEKWLGKNHLSDLTENERGDIYFISTDEFGYLKKKSFGIYEKKTRALDRFRPLINDDLTNITILGERDVLIGAKEGFIHFDPTLDHKSVDKMNVFLNAVEISFLEDSTTIINASFLSEDKIDPIRSIKFDFGSPYFPGFEENKFSFKLEGFDQTWSSWTTNSVKEYTNLSPGKYIFGVKARNIYGTESPATILQFEIKPRWFESMTAKFSYFILGILGLSLLVYLQDLRHRKKHSALSASKELEINQKNKQLSEVSAQSKQEIEELKNENLRSEINHKNNELASVTMHLLNKNKFMQDIRKRVDQMISDGSESKNELKRIVKTIDRSLSKDDSWSQFAFHFDQVHGDFLKKLSNRETKLTPQETKLAAYLRINMSSKEIADLLNISVRGVELARYRLRKKLKLSREQNLNEYLREI